VTYEQRRESGRKFRSLQYHFSMTRVRMSLAPAVLLLLAVSHFVIGLRDKVPCLDNDNFYRNPNRDAARVWSSSECAKYYFCVEGEIFKFECSTSLAFDINRQICDFKDNVANCDVTAEETTPRPLFNTDEPICPKEEHACADGTCLPTALFCDGHAGKSPTRRRGKFLNLITQPLFSLQIAWTAVTKAGVILIMTPMLHLRAIMPTALCRTVSVQSTAPWYVRTMQITEKSV
jgi:hypothetical protein